MSEAFTVWRYYAREICADLARYYHLDIAQWCDGTMPSRRLLTLLDGLPDESLFKTWAGRGGDWTEAQYIQARLVNEVALSRADGKGYMPDLVQSPAQVAQQRAEQDYRAYRHAETLKQLQGEEDCGGNHP